MAGKAQLNTASNLELTAMRRVLNILQKLPSAQQRTRVAEWIMQAAEELNDRLGQIEAESAAKPAAPASPSAPAATGGPTNPPPSGGSGGGTPTSSAPKSANVGAPTPSGVMPRSF